MNWFKRSAHVAPDGTAAAPPAIASWLVLIAVVLCTANLALSALLLLEHHGQSLAVSAVHQLCGAGESGCATVAASKWSSIGGVPLAAVGLAFYASVALLLLLGLLAGPPTREAVAGLAFLLLALAVVVDLFLLGVQRFSIGAYCKLCVATYLMNVLAAAALLPARRDGSVVSDALAGREGRLAFSAWGLSVLFLVGGVALAELGLSRGQSGAAANVLGTGGGLTPPTSLPPGATEADRYREEARVAAEQARRLQETLDDPAKLERYLTEKAQRDFEAGPVNMLDLAGVPFKGPVQAPVKVVEFSDFLCPFCRNVAGAFDKYLPTTAGRVVVYYKNYPLEKECNTALSSSVHQGACLLALGGLCAQEQGRFWPYHDRVFAAPLSNPQVGDVQRLALEAGLDAGAFEKCLASGSQRERLTAQINEARNAGVNSTPTLFINGKRLPNLNNFGSTVDAELRRLGQPPIGPPPGN